MNVAPAAPPITQLRRSSSHRPPRRRVPAARGRPGAAAGKRCERQAPHGVPAWGWRSAVSATAGSWAAPECYRAFEGSWRRCSLRDAHEGRDAPRGQKPARAAEEGRDQGRAREGRFDAGREEARDGSCGEGRDRHGRSRSQAPASDRSASIAAAKKNWPGDREAKQYEVAAKLRRNWRDWKVVPSDKAGGTGARSPAKG